MKSIRMRWVLVSLVTLCVWAAVLALIFGKTSEPIYKNKPLSAWVKYSYANRSVTYEWEHAVHDGGAASIPTLLLMLQANDSSLKLKLLDFAKKHNITNIDFVPAEIKQDAACDGFDTLGNRAIIAVPDLIAIYDRNISRNSRRDVLAIFYRMGPIASNATPALVRWLKTSDDEKGQWILQVLSRIDAEPTVIIPILTAGLQNSSASYRKMSADLLGSYLNDAKPAIPDLLKALQDPAPEVRYAAGDALRKIDPNGGH
jgi:HEAT repeat